MFIKNRLNKEVKLRSFEGYSFVLPPGVCAIWTPAGEELLKVHKIESKGVDKFGLSNGNGIPALMEATEAEWKKEGRKLAEVKRYQINYKLIPRPQLLKVALKRGVAKDKVSEYQIDSSIDAEIIAQEINTLPVPEEIKYPANIEDDENVEDAEDVEDDETNEEEE